MTTLLKTSTADLSNKKLVLQIRDLYEDLLQLREECGDEQRGGKLDSGISRNDGSD
jgi:hypothetical protein